MPDDEIEEDEDISVYLNHFHRQGQTAVAVSMAELALKEGWDDAPIAQKWLDELKRKEKLCSDSAQAG